MTFSKKIELPSITTIIDFEDSAEDRNREIEVTATATLVQRPEPDVGIMESYVEEYTIREAATGNEIPKEILSRDDRTRIEELLDECL